MEIEFNRYAVVFPGQGAQYVGMGLDLFEHCPEAIDVFDRAERATGLPIKSLCFEGPEELLGMTANTQPCVLAMNMACHEVFSMHISGVPSYYCGHSAGEYSALVAAGVLSLDDAFRLVLARGRIMSDVKEGGMAALKGVAREEIACLCNESAVPGGVLVPANLNSPAETVVSGDAESLDRLICLAVEKNIRVIPLNVSGAFHSPLMEKAAALFTGCLKDVIFRNAMCPVISNVTARPVSEGLLWMSLLGPQMIAPVFWEQSIYYLASQGINLFVEVGPGNVLSKLIRNIIPTAVTVNVEDLASLEKALKVLRNN